MLLSLWDPPRGWAASSDRRPRGHTHMEMNMQSDIQDKFLKCLWVPWKGMANINVCVHLTGTPVRDKARRPMIPVHTNDTKIHDTLQDSEAY